MTRQIILFPANIYQASLNHVIESHETAFPTVVTNAAQCDELQRNITSRKYAMRRISQRQICDE